MACFRSRALFVIASALLVVFATVSFAQEASDRESRRAAQYSQLLGREGEGRPAAQAGKMLWKGELVEGATPVSGGVRFVLRSENATRVELELFGQHADVIDQERSNALSSPVKVVALEKRDSLWVADVEGAKAGEVYGYRLWGPNWKYDPSFKPGSEVGFVADVDGQGNRFNPNKLILDPWAKVFTRDADWSQTAHVSGPKHRLIDSAATQGKAVVVDDRFDWGSDQKPGRNLKDTIVYEVHVKGMSQRFPGVANPGTYRALADDKVIAYLKKLGVTAVELLPIHETQNDTNDLNPDTTKDKNYWGYMTMGYFAPDRRYASDTSADGPVREFKTMVKKLHAAGLEVWMDVVYNHTAEGGSWPVGPDTANLLCFRGVDNQMFYELTADNKFFWDNSGCGGNLRTAHPATGQFVVDSLKYWSNVMRVDGFRFDLASVVGNGRDKAGYSFQRDGGVLEQIVKQVAESGSRAKVIAEPWACGDGTYQVGNFPRGWAEWNGQYRDTLRKFLKGDASAGDMIDKVNGSYGLFGDDGRAPSASVNFVTAHDGLTLFDLVSYNVNSGSERDKLNSQAWPRGPSDGGEERNNSWNCQIPGASSDDTGALRRQQARNAFALLLFSNGTPMILGGDERLRTQYGNNNAYNLDSETSWLEWKYADRSNQLDGVKTTSAQLSAFEAFSHYVVGLRRDFPAFHKSGWWAGDRDGDGDGSPGIQWLGPNGSPDYGSKHFAYRIDGAREELDMNDAEYRAFPMQGQKLLVMVNASGDTVEYKVPKAPGSKAWYRAIDTHSWAEANGNFWPTSKQEKVAGSYGVNARSVVVLIAR